MSKQRTRLLSLRAACGQRAEELSISAGEVFDDGSPIDIVDDGGFGEGATHDVERERVLALVSVATDRLQAIDVALARLDAGTYGICAGCHEPIDPARLEAVPEAALCVRCKSGTALRR